MFFHVMIILAIILLLLFIRQKCFKLCCSVKYLGGKTVIVTGGTSGIGLQIAKEFAKRGARVIVACPFEEEGRIAEKNIKEETGNKNIKFSILDLGSCKSVKEFAANILKTEERLDILVNNAGIGAPENIMTEDGINLMMQINYYGHFLLTILLLPLLKKSGTPSDPARILNNGSMMHRIPFLAHMSLNAGGHNLIEKYMMYGTSKLCLTLFTRELNKKLDSTVVVNSVDPGTVATDIYYTSGPIFGFGLKNFFYHFGKTTLEGAQSVVHVALHTKGEEVRGRYFRKCKVHTPSSTACDDNLAKKVWEESVKLVKLTKEELDECLRF